MANALIIAAEFCNGSKARSPSLSITRIDPQFGQRTTMCTLAVPNKREARKVAARFGATPWNF